MNRLYLMVALLLFFTACTPQAVSPTETLPAPQLTIVTSIPPTLTPSPTPIPTTEEWIYPYTIAGLREHDYQGSEINVGDILEETDLYTRYAIDYSSDGLTIPGLCRFRRVGRSHFRSS